MPNKAVFLATFMVIMWSIGIMVLPSITNRIEPLWTAFIRFFPPVPFIYLFSLRYNKSYFVTSNEFYKLFLLASIFVLQTYLFHAGSVGSSGSRITIAIFTFPVFMPLVCPFIVPGEKFNSKKMYGAVCGFIGFTIAILTFQKTKLEGCLTNDLIELLSAILIAINLAYVKRLALTINKWKILTWQFLIASIMFLVLGLLTETTPDFMNLETHVWNSIWYQIFVIGIFCWMSQQYLVAKYNPASVTAFFCIAPISSIIIEMLKNTNQFAFGIETFGVILGGSLVGLGIFLSTKFD